jgi:hypothetical protein
MLQTSLGAERFRVHLVGWVLAAAALLGGALIGALMIPSKAVGATPDTDYRPQVLQAPDRQDGGRFGSRMVALGDVNGDGTKDLLVSAQGLNANGLARSGRVYVVSGKTREVLYTRESPEPQVDAGFGNFLAGPGDLNSDGIPDFVVGPQNHDVFTGSGTGCGQPEPNGCNESQGKAWVFNGANGALLYDIDNPVPQANAGFGRRLGTTGDITWDDRPDLIVGAQGNDKPAGCGNVPGGTPLPAGCRKDEGQAFIFNGFTGELIRTLDLPAEDRAGPTCGGSRATDSPDPPEAQRRCGNFGGAVQSPGDVNGDGVADQQVNAFSFNENQGRIYLFSGRNGELLRKIDHPSPAPNTFFGFQDVTQNSPGDVTGDGVPDIYGAANRVGEGLFPGYVFNGATGALLYPLRVPSPQLGDDFFTMDRTDYNKDGTPDLYVGRQAITTVPPDQNGGTFVYDGRDGTLLKALELPPADRQTGIAGNFGPFLGFALAAPGDLNGDCEPDYVATSMRYDEGSVQDAGRVYFFLSDGPSACPAQVPQPGPPQPGPPQPGPQPPLASCPVEGAPGFLNPAKLRVSRARVLREDRRLDVLAPITARADGEVDVEFQADNRRDTFKAEVTAANTALDEIRILEPITRGQANLGTGIVNLTYLGDEDTRPEFVRLRAASQRAELDVEEISLIGDRLSAQGSVTSRAEGIVRLRYSYVDPDGSPAVHLARATIQDDGDWKLEGDQVPAELARCGGYLSIQFTGFFERRIRGEQLAYQLNAGQTRQP